MRLIGIDPGVHGALAVLDATGRELLELHDLPTRKQGKGGAASSQMVCAMALADLLRPHIAPGTICAIEVAIVKPPQKLVSARTIGLNYGVILATLSLLGIGVMEVAPHEWKKRLSLTDDKDASMSLALSLFPTARPLLTRHDRAEALLIARASTVTKGVL